ncbi:MAG: 2,3-bisphosphoglycerate-independent phosphoglycerate mutase [Alphaproteobacteria bacterium]|nr:2,3-bisphosphoglycerate-independent phosphoglycerate mutase [Alphaproteobacteria bacterium]
MNSANSTPRPMVLCILDGWGNRPHDKDNAVTCANTPVFDECWEKYPHALLNASEEYVGLPKGQIGNSEVGHMNLGAGRVVLQDLPMIDKAIAKGELATNLALLNFISKLKAANGTCHIMGLASPGGVHSHQNHIVALAKILSASGIEVAVHAFLDGRDVPPQSALEQIGKLQNDLSSIEIKTICGRYYAMDRDKRWARVEKAYDLLTQGSGSEFTDPLSAIKSSYDAGVFDEFVLPAAHKSYSGMKDGDGILFANFRADRAREILTALIDPSFTGFNRKKTVRFSVALGMVEYSDQLNPMMEALFPPKEISNGLGELISRAGLTQLRIAETEKYPHVTFFFNGGREEPYDKESRIMIMSPKVATYDLKPEMSAFEVTDKVTCAIESGEFDFIVLNYANPDMVGHTGSLSAAIKAVETIDACLGRLISSIKKAGGTIFLTADHGNCETMHDKTTDGPHTAHTLERVPAILINAPEEIKNIRDGKLADVAPTILSLMNLPKPDEMDGESLIV